MFGILYGLLIMIVAVVMALAFAPHARREDEPTLEWLWAVLFVIGIITVIGSAYELIWGAV
ncbi:hypothetical protein [Cognatishimia sp. MH4019]|uniref:hypothetical protein n=1 Tax=Cognatishimia sp. MH4019 TaxID=2854030 RepID=UPI001CD7A882|nr:hypothetical protein [Cognatishimia sp. MH4019]